MILSTLVEILAFIPESVAVSAEGFEQLASTAYAGLFNVVTKLTSAQEIPHIDLSLGLTDADSVLVQKKVLWSIRQDVDEYQALIDSFQAELDKVDPGEGKTYLESKRLSELKHSITVNIKDLEVALAKAETELYNAQMIYHSGEHISAQEYRALQTKIGNLQVTGARYASEVRGFY